jgi:hypothetical protein
MEFVFLFVAKKKKPYVRLRLTFVDIRMDLKETEHESAHWIISFKTGIVNMIMNFQFP